MTTSNDEKDQAVMALIEEIGEVVNGHDFDTVMNALAYMLAHGLVNTDKNKAESLAQVARQLDNLYDSINTSNPVQ